MLTRCPYRHCLKEFECETARESTCPACLKTVTIQPLEHWRQLDKQAERHESADTLANEPTLKTLVFPAPEESALIAVVEDVRSLWNIGSIFRSSDGAGVQALFLCGISGTPPRKEIEKTSLGADQTVPWLYARSTLELFPLLAERGFQIIGLERTAVIEPRPSNTGLAQTIAAGQLSNRICLVVGNEVRGLSRETLSACDQICYLPMRGKKESLNVAVAFGIAAYLLAEALCGPC